MSVSPRSVAVGPDGSVFFSTFSRILQVSTRFPGIGAGELTVASPDGSEVWIFDAAGRHLRTVDAFTGSTLAELGTDSEGRLVTVSDLDGNVTTIERDATGNPTGLSVPSDSGPPSASTPTDSWRR